MRVHIDDGARLTIRCVPYGCHQTTTVSTVRCTVLGNLYAWRAAADQPTHTEQVEESHPEAIVEPVFGTAAGARPMIDGYGKYLHSCALKQCGQEAMHVVELRQLQERRTMHHFDTAARVRRAIT